jgi:hypothetical protein
VAKFAEFIPRQWLRKNSFQQIKENKTIQQLKIKANNKSLFYFFFFKSLSPFQFPLKKSPNLTKPPNQCAKKRKEENIHHMARIGRIIIACNIIFLYTITLISISIRLQNILLYSLLHERAKQQPTTQRKS